MIIFLHGFNSSAQGNKAKALSEYFPDRVFAPDYPVYDPRRALPFLRTFIDEKKAVYTGPEPLLLIGSSLGGFYANILANEYDRKCVLINPSTQPWLTLQQALGENTNYYTGEKYTLTTEMLDQMKVVAPVQCDSKVDRLVLLDEADEVIDYRLAEACYADCARLIVYPGGSHRFDHLDESMGEIEALYLLKSG